QGNRPVLILCPGAEYGPSKRWPEAYYAHVAAHKIRRGWQVWLMGAGKGNAVAEAIRGQLEESQQVHCHYLAGTTQLAGAKAMMARADAVVSNDSGLMHIAAALQRPLVVIYGSTSPAFTPPLTERVRIVSTAIECSPCFERECPKQHHRCLKDLPPSMVLDALQDVAPVTVTLP